MKELITEEQAGQIVLLLSVLVSTAGLGFGFWKSRRPGGPDRLVWAQALLGALAGPVLWIFWRVYNAIEDAYGLDSLKALGINFFIAVGLGALFFLLYFFLPRWVGGKPGAGRRG
jgi:hypothetical protein